MRQILQVLRQKDVLDQQRKYITETASKDEQLKRAFDEIGALNKKLADQETESEQKVRINVTCSAGIFQRINEVLSEKKKDPKQGGLMPASITWHDHHRTHAHKHVIWAVVALKSSFTLRLHQHDIANTKVVELFPYSRPPPSPLVAPSRDGISIAANTSFTRTQERARPNANRDGDDVEMKVARFNYFPLLKKEKKEEEKAVVS